MFGLGLILTVAYVPGWVSPAVSPRFAALSVLAPALLLWRREAIPFTRAHLAGCALIAWAALTLLWSPQQPDSVDALWQTLILPGVCFCLGSQSVSLRPLSIGAALGLGVSSAIAILQWIGVVLPIQQIEGPGGLFLNTNYMAEAAALVLIAVVAERMWWAIPLLLPAALLGAARGALVAATAGIGLKFSRYPVTFFAIACVALILGLESMGARVGLSVRLEIWRSAIGQLTWLGHGIGSFWAVHAGELYNGGVAAHAHNEFLELASDLGAIGVSLFAWFAWELRGPATTSRLVLAGLAAEALFAFPAHMPVTVALGACCAGAAARDRLDLRRQSFGRGNIIRERLA